MSENTAPVVPDAFATAVSQETVVAGRWGVKSCLPRANGQEPGLVPCVTTNDLAEACAVAEAAFTQSPPRRLGGHAPVLVLDDANADGAAKALTANKLRNAGQVCIVPTRFYVQERVYDRFASALTASTKSRWATG